MTKKLIIIGFFAFALFTFLAITGCEKLRGGSTSQEYKFNKSTDKWWPAGNIKLHQDTKIKQEGYASMKISGSPGASSWCLAGSPEFKLEPEKKYKLSGWMYVTSYNDGTHPPFFQVGINKDGKRLTNNSAQIYNLNAKNTWQKLSVEFVTPHEQNLSGLITVVKGTNQADVIVDINIDDIKLN